MKFRIPLSFLLIDVAGSLQSFAYQLLEDHPPEQPIVIAFTDATRASPDQLLIEPVLRVLFEQQRNVTMLCAVGMHRPSTADEKRAKLGDWIVQHATVIRP